MKHIFAAKASPPRGIFFKDDAYWMRGERETEGPFCSRCKDVSGSLVRLIGYSVTREYKRCPECDTIVRIRPGGERPSGIHVLRSQL